MPEAGGVIPTALGQERGTKTRMNDRYTGKALLGLGVQNPVRGGA